MPKSRHREVQGSSYEGNNFISYLCLSLCIFISFFIWGYDVCLLVKVCLSAQ